VNSRRDSEYWRDNARNDVLSDSLRRILSCWIAGEDLSREVQHQRIERYYASASWHCLLAGYGVYPQRVSPPASEAQRCDPARIDDFLDRCALNFRAHDEVLAEMRAAGL
jgi:hypothetical protein